jgi:hypothetical protein
MDRVAQATPADRAELFRSAAAALRPERSPAIIEKDFWVCWTLHRIYAVMKFQPELIFKGGTSLSKAYNAIERFSEDVDLSVSRRDLGFTDSRDPEEEGISGKESRRRIAALILTCQETVRNRLLPELRKDFESVIGRSGWSIELDAIDPQTVSFTYPRSEPAGRLPEAIRPAIRLEMGARSDDWPAEDREIRCYAAEAFPQVFEVAGSCRTHVLDARRTFWEKMTLLHAEFHRPTDGAGADRLSRHYYDVYQLSRQEIGRQALSRMDLLERVVAHKRLFFAAAWAHYETAVPGSFHLVPPAGRMPTFQADYTRMREMIFGDAPPWETIVRGLRELEDKMNGK